MGHPAIRGALVVGATQFRPALIPEPAVPPADDTAAEALIELVWPLVEEINKATVAHGRIGRDLIVLAKRNLPFLRAGKGTVVRGQTVQAYHGVIEKAYRNSEAAAARRIAPFQLDLSSTEALTNSLVSLFRTRMGVHSMGPDEDIFSAGVDSLQVIALSNLLQSSFKMAGVTMDPSTLSTRAIYRNATPKQLAVYLDSIAYQGNNAHDDHAMQEAEFDRLVKRYTRDLPGPQQAAKFAPSNEGQTVLLTGTTGSLGAYILDQLCSSTSVARIIALNRDKDGGYARQVSANTARGLGRNFAKVDFLHADLSKADLGIGTIKYYKLLAEVDRIIHNAWPVNFNISVASFEPSIQGVRHLVDFASAALKLVPIIFVSSISSVDGWTATKPVPEDNIDGLPLPRLGYGRSKLAGSLILDAASRYSGIPAASMRVGQIAGPRGSDGIWNRHEYIPSLIASSVYMGILPRHLGSQEVVDWTPVEDIAGLILDVSGVTTTVPVSSITGYFHGVNIHPVQWSELAGAIKEYYAGRIKRLVSLEEWVSALEKSIETTKAPEIDQNPGIKLLDTYKAMIVAQGKQSGPLELSMERTLRHSPTMRRVDPVTTDLIRNWCRQWDF